MEVGRPAQQLSAGFLDLLRFQLKVLADFAVEVLDRLHGEVEPLVFALAGVHQFGVRARYLGIGDGQIYTGGLRFAVGAGLDGQAHGGAGEGPRTAVAAAATLVWCRVSNRRV
jgi:hypothetical protein